MEKRTQVPRGVRNIYIADWVMLVLLFLGLFGALIPLLIVPPFPISGGRIAGGVTAVSVIGFFLLLTIIALFAATSGRPWGRTYHTAFSILSLLIIPVGTIIQGIALYNLYKDPATRDFYSSGKPPTHPKQAA